MQTYSQTVMEYASKTSGLEHEYLLNTRADIAEATVGLGAMVTFLGLYISVLYS